jgi:hypothetical protein
MMVAYATWVITALVLIVGQLAGDLHLSIVEERRALDNASLRAAAISGFEAYRFMIAKAAGPDYSHPQEPYRIDPVLTAFKPAAEIRTICYHPQRDGNVIDPVPVLGGLDEESRLPILHTDLESLAMLPGVSEAMGRQLMDHLAANPERPPRRIEDLSAVPGWNALDLDPLRPLVTFHGEGRVNINSAAPAVLTLLGLSSRAVREMQDFLAGPNGQRGDADDRFFKGVSEVSTRLREYGLRTRVLSEWSAMLQSGRVGVRSTHYRVYARAVREATGEQYEVESILRVDGGFAQPLTWRERRPS